MKRFGFAAIVLLFMPAFAHAWGGDGHQLVCLIAEDRLTPEAQAAVQDLLGKAIDISDAPIAKNCQSFVKPAE